MRTGRSFHTWAATISTIVQAVAVVGGVIFAALQVHELTIDRVEKRREVTYEHLKELDTPPLSDVVAFLHVKTTIATVVTPEEFNARTGPFRPYLADLERCVSAQICDGNMAENEVCPLVL